VKKRAMMGLVLFAALATDVRCATPPGPVRSGPDAETMLEWNGVCLPFVENVGQVRRPEVRYIANIFGGTILVSEQGWVSLALIGRADADGQREGCVLRESFPSRAAAPVRGMGRIAAPVSYWKGKDLSRRIHDAPAYAAVDLGAVAPGVTLTLRAFGRNVEKLFVVGPDAKPADILCKLEGAKRLSVTGAGRLAAETEGGVVEFTRPVAYQETGGARTAVEVAYVVRGLEYGFAVGAYDSSRPLVIDPLLASTFLGGSGDDSMAGLVIHTNGSVFAVGTTVSPDFPSTPGAFETAGPGDEDVFISKFSSGLSNLLASTFLGGAGIDHARAVALGTDGTVYVTGYTSSDDFPAATNAFQDTLFADSAFIARFDPALTNLMAATYLGGNFDDDGRAIRIATNGYVYVAGVTHSASFPTTTNAFALTYPGWGSWSQYTLSVRLKRMQGLTSFRLCESDLGYYEFAFGPGDELDVSKVDHIEWLVTELAATQAVGLVTGVWQDVSISASNGLLRVSLNGTPILNVQDTTPHILTGGDIWLKSYVDTWGRGTTSEAYVDNVLVSNQQGVVWFDDFEQDNLDNLWAFPLPVSDVGPAEWIRTEFEGQFCLHGLTTLTNGDWGYAEASPKEPGSEYAGFVARLNPELTELKAATFLGGEEANYIEDLALGSGGRVHVAGTTYSPDFPTSTNAFDRTFDGDWMNYGVSLRFKLDSGAAELNVRHSEGEDARAGRYRILFRQDHVEVAKERPKGMLRLLGQANPTLATGTWHQVLAASTSSGLVVRVDGALVLTVSDRDPLVLGGVSLGVGSGSVAAVSFDDLAITNAAGAIYTDDFESGDIAAWTASEGWAVLDDGGNHVLRGIPGGTNVWARADTPWFLYDTEGRCDGFVVTLDGALSTLLGSTFLGGAGQDAATSVAVGSNGTVYAGGWTLSSDYPTSENAYDRGDYSEPGFITRLDQNLTNAQASTLLGEGATIEALAVARDGSVFVAGDVSGYMPTSWDAYDESWNGFPDVFASRLSGDLTTLLASTLLGGTNENHAFALALAPDDSVYVAGSTRSPDFPVTNACDAAWGGGEDGFISRLDAFLSRAPRPYISVQPASRQFGYVLVGVAVTQVFDVVNTGRVPLAIGTVSLTDGLDLVHFKLTNDHCSGQSVDPLSTETCRVSVIFRPTNVWGKAVHLVIPSDDPDTPQRKVPLYGSGRSTNAAEALFLEGLQALTNYLGDSGLTSDLLTANDKFGQALAQNPNHYAAVWYRLITRVAALPYDSEVAQLLTDLGMPEAGRDLLNWTAELPDPLPPDSPDVGYAVGVLDNRMVNIIEEGLLNLARIPTNWTGNILLSPEYLPIDNEVQVDAGDAQVVQGILSCGRGLLWMIQSHDWHMSFADLLNDDLTLGDHLETYPMLGTLTNVPRFARAAALFIQAIDYYQTGSSLIRAETDGQDDDLLIFDPDQLNEEAVFRHALEQIRDSLSGTNASPFRFELSQELTLKYMFTNPISPRVLATGLGAQQIMASNILFQVDRGLANMATLTESFSETLSPDHSPVKRNVEVDYGDIALIRACLQLCRALILVAQAYDMDDVNLVTEYERNPLLVGDIPAAHTRFLGITNTAALAAASNALSAALAGYQVASAFIRSEADDQADDLFVIQSNRLWLAEIRRFGHEEDSFRTLVQSLSNSLSGPVLVDYVDHQGAHEFYETMHLGRVFTTNYVTRAHLPEFDATNRPVSGTFPDPTFNGLFPEMSQWHVADALDLGLVDSDGLGLPDLWQLHYFGTLGHNPATVAASGMTLYDEFHARTDPGNAASCFMLTRGAFQAGDPACVQLRWRSRPYQRYVVEWATNIPYGSWTEEAILPATPYTNFYTNRVEDTKRKYYRVRVGD